VTGLDLAPSAVHRAEQRTAEDGLEAKFRLGDFLRDRTGETFDWVFEHTLFCAIHPSERELYVEAALLLAAPVANSWRCST
jgi:hypothetical protein